MKIFNLQLFANAKNNTTLSGSNTQQSENYGSHTSSSSHTEGQSVTDTKSHSTTDTTGQSFTQNYGKSWASGQVADTTQANFDKYNQDYVQSDKVTAAYDALQQTLTNKPTFESSYADKLSSIYDQIMNRDAFNYNFNEDAMYQQYKDQYTQMGKQAMQNTIGAAQAANGGYGSSYAQSVGQQTYQQYLQELNNIIPELRQQALEQYQMEGEDLYNKYGITNDAYNNEYNQYRDSVADWQSDRSFNYGLYSDERNFDYGQFTDNRSYWQNEYWNEKNAEQSNMSTSQTDYWENSETNAQSHSETQYSEDTQSESSTTGWSNASSSTNKWQTSLASAFSAGATGSGGGGNNGGGNNVDNAKQNAANNWNTQGATPYTPMYNYQPSAVTYKNALSDDSILKNDSVANNVVDQIAKGGEATAAQLLENGYTRSGKGTYEFTPEDFDYLVALCDKQGISVDWDKVEEIQNSKKNQNSNSSFWGNVASSFINTGWNLYN